MAVIPVWHKIDEECITPVLRDAVKKLESANGEVVLDFASVRRLGPSALRAMEGFADDAQHRGVKVVLRGVNIDAYRVLKLVKLAKRFSFVS